MFVYVTGDIRASILYRVLLSIKRLIASCSIMTRYVGVIYYQWPWHVLANHHQEINSLIILNQDARVAIKYTLIIKQNFKSSIHLQFYNTRLVFIKRYHFGLLNFFVFK